MTARTKGGDKHVNDNDIMMHVPDDYRPQKPLDYMAIYVEHEEGVNLLSNEQAGIVFKRLISFGKAFATSYDDALQVDTADMDAMTAYIAKQLAGGIKRAAQRHRMTSYARSGANNGGRPKKKT